MAATDLQTLLDASVFPDTSLLITEDGKPVDNLFVEKQYRLLTEPLWTSWTNHAGRPFRVLANVGLFFQYREPPLVPDAMFAIDVESPRSPRESDFRSYFIWVVGKPPDVVVEIVSDKRGREDTDKLKAYERIKVPFYVIFDPDEVLDGGVLRTYGLLNEKYVPIDPIRFGDLGLGLTLWEGEVEDADDTWLRWVDSQGQLVPNAKERADAEAKRAETAEKHAEIAEKHAETAQKHAETAQKHAETAEKRAETAEKHAETLGKRLETAEERAKYLEEKLRNAGISANGTT